jgi:hypothetical protein
MNDSITTTTNVSVDPDQLHILAATATEAVLLGTTAIGENENIRWLPCIIHVPRTAYLEAMSGWLDEKADYYSRYGHYCGAGNIVWEAQMTGDTVNIADDLDDLVDKLTNSKKRWVNVPIYTGSDFTVDMEHG